ncbi:hypothetical protein KB20921_08070 [Edwardsiella ictaluri]|nr:hypothetical protein KH20906_08050 [Edwardsiella ictaluri]BEI01546.1 hypothetical protein KB20921_08070 [Edwardsiella ictaluri]BEI05018.1 hypothetical protein KH201010_08040 [Edwardsiella ictaluri]BEI08472.1 hypothetical protein STU22726_08030 [Edwardsiella ictaluri]BEI11955.1 hypothetical protein STU22816_08080 [Edwardsiella ictaluri]
MLPVRLKTHLQPSVRPATVPQNKCQKSDLFTAQAWQGHNGALAVLTGDSGGKKT